MLAPGEGMGTTTVFPSNNLRLLPQEDGSSNGMLLGTQEPPSQRGKQASGKVKISQKRKQHVFTHGLHHRQHFSSDSPVRFMIYSEAAAAFISLHSDHSVCLWSEADGRKQVSKARLPFMGLTNTKISGCLVGWGPGPVFTVLDSELNPLGAAQGGLDIRVCQAAEHSTTLVTAGVGNVCVWSVRPRVCMVKIQEGLEDRTFTLMALAPPRCDRHHRAFVVCGRVVTVVDLDARKVLEHKKDLCLLNITAILYCSQLDCLITASEELSIRIWGPNWERRVAFVGHYGVVNSLFYCPASDMLLSASLDGTIRCWNVEEGEVIKCVHAEQRTPLLFIGGDRKGDAFFSFSHKGVDFWTIRPLYSLHCKLKGDKGAPLRQILVTSCPAPYPTRVLCVSGDSDVMLVAAETGAVLTSFKAKKRLLCADYCLQKEVLLALTETGTVLQANTLTNPITLMQEWKRRGHGRWKHNEHMTEGDAQNLPIPGRACCLVLYSCVTDTQGALEEWRSLQESRGCSHRNKAALDDAHNKFFIILGQSGGCLSVVKINDGEVLYRVPAHNGQRVVALQAYPEHSFLFSTGEDRTVMVWYVTPFIQQCLSRQLILHCDQLGVHLTALGPQLALTNQEPGSGTYNLKHFNLLSQRQADHPAKDGHLDNFTGLCACPDLEVFVSSSLDGTMCVWNEENDLIMTLQLNAVPERLAYGGFGGKLFLGIRGDLYRMNCEKFLPDIYQQMLLYTYCDDPVPDFPIVQNEEKCSERAADTDKNEEVELPAISSGFLLTEGVWRETVALNKDLSAILEGSAKCKKEKPTSTNETKKEAFDRYMKMIYRLPPNIKVDLDDIFKPDMFLFYPELRDDKSCKLPPLKEDVHPESRLNTSVYVGEKKGKKPLKTQMKVLPRSVAIPKKNSPINSSPVISPIKQPKAKTPTQPLHSPRTQTPLPQRELTLLVPVFLTQFADAGWFKELYPDIKHIPSSLSPEDFSLQLLGCLNTCSDDSMIKILAALQALQALHSQGLLQSTDRLYQGLMLLVSGFSAAERTVLVEMLNVLICLKSAGYDLVKNLLALLAFKKVGVRGAVIHILTALEVNEAEQWLCPELDSWEPSDTSDIWKSFCDRAERWLELWIAKYRKCDEYLSHSSGAEWKPPAFSMVDVLNYFCSVQKDEHQKARCVAPAPGPINSVLSSQYDCSQPIIRLGETHSMARKSRPPGVILPPLRNRPSLTHFPKFISLPVSRVNLRPFHTHSDEDWVKVSARRYYIQQQSGVDYYK